MDKNEGSDEYYDFTVRKWKLKQQQPILRKRHHSKPQKQQQRRSEKKTGSYETINTHKTTRKGKQRNKDYFEFELAL